MLSRIADKLVLQPTTHAIATEGKRRLVLPVGDQSVEVWIQRTSGASDAEQNLADLYVLKFVGTGGRAERATEHPAEYWTDCDSEVWTVNPPGYGGSRGRASLQWLAPAARVAYDAIANAARGRPIIVAGNSLGTNTALYVAAHCEVDGLLLRNPPPLRQLIVGRYGWWTLGIGAWLVARRVPNELCAIRNASAALVPAVFVMSGKDRTVPPRYQRLVFQAYGGEHRLLVMPNCDHASSMEERQRPHYIELLEWLRQRAIQWRASGPAEKRGAIVSDRLGSTDP